jgi:hypothetical protein
MPGREDGREDAEREDSMTIITRALHTRELHEAVRLLQDALGITTGDVAAHAFSGLPEGDDSWPKLSVDERRRWIADYLGAEVFHA